MSITSSGINPSIQINYKIKTTRGLIPDYKRLIS